MQTKQILIGTVVIVAAGGLLGAVLNGQNVRVEEMANLGDVPAVTATDYEGNRVALSEFAGRPRVINSWAVWCPFCREELADFARLQQEFGEEVVVIAIDRQESLNRAKGFTDELGITDDILFLLDETDAFYRGIGGFSMPETIFVDADGNIVVHKRGPMDLEEMREHTNKIITN